MMLFVCVGLVMDFGLKVIYNGVEIGWVDIILEVICDGELVVKFILDVDLCYIYLILVNVNVDIKVIMVFGGKYVLLIMLKNLIKRWIMLKDVIDVWLVIIEINMLF